MGFLTRLLAGLTAAAALGAGLTGTANAVDVTGAAGTTKSVVKLAADDTNNLPDHIVNGNFEYPVKSDMPVNDGNFWYISQNDGSYFANGTVLGKRYKLPEGFDKAKFAWHSTQTGDTYYPDLERADDVQVDYTADGTNHYSEISAAQSGATIYQDVATVPGVMYKWSLKHASLDSSHLDKMSVIIGEPGKETAQEATRTTANGHGDKLGKVGTVISTKVSNPEMPAGNKFQEGAHTGQWETYTGTYIATGTVTRFAFRSVEGYSAWDGNLLDDISFSKAYKLTYDKNASDATGSVPSDTTANTVKQAKADATGTVKTVTDTKTKTSGTVKTVADTNASLPDHLVNGDFNVNYHDQWKDSFGGWTSIDPNAGKTLHATSLPNGPSWKWTAINGWDKSKFGWTSTQKAGSNVQQKANAVELQYDDSTADNVYAELCAYEAGTAIYQDIRTVPGTLYKVRLKHASLNSTYLDKMQVMIGTPGHEQPVEMTRTTVNGHGDKLNEKSTTIATKVTNSNNRHHADQWETYEGTYLIPDGQTTTRFTFKSIDAKQLDYGNVLDDIVFDKAYRLSYDKNASDATGKVPSNQRGKENTVQPANAKTAGTVRTVADKTASGLTVHDLKNGEIAPVQYGDFKFSTTDGVTADQITDVNGFTVKTNWNPTVENQAYGGRSLDTMYQPNRNGASLVLHHVGQWRDSSGTQRWLNARITVNGQNLGSLVYYESQHKFLASYGKWDRHTSSRPYMDVTVDFLLDDGSTPQGLRGVTGFTDLDGGTSGYNEGVELVSGFDGAYVRSDAHLARFGTNGWAGATDENENNADAHGMKHYVGATFTGSSFRVRWSVASGQARGSGFQPVDSTIAYRLTYNKNAQDATGSIPSDTAANTTQPAKSETDGKVSDLVQRTTTHADGSVTVKTIDTSTDVVSGCQVYYPAGQRITLATMAKDDDCWDSSMLSRPGHTQLGWNQDRNATAAQPEVTMVEGGMTVFAVWVGNPVLTYDTNKPSTWSGQMPSTPASISVTYNTAATDGSGWQSGDTTKIRGYRFLGWYTGPQDNTGLYQWATPLTGNVTVYAHWQRLQANVIYDKNGGTGSHANTTGWQYSDVTVPSDTSKSFKRDGYYFKYWNTQKDGKGTTYKDGGQVPLQDKDVTLYAIWAPYHTVITETGGVGLPVLVAAGMGLLVVGIGSTVMLTRRMRGEQ